MKTIEELSLNAWPATRITHFDGWVLRFSNGFTRRANSVNVLGPSNLPVSVKVDWCEEQYGLAELPTVFKSFPDPLLDDLNLELDRRGYEVEGEAHVMTVDLKEDLQIDVELSVSPYLTDEWYADAIKFNRVPPHHQIELRSIIERIQPTCGFATLYYGSEPVAVGLGVVERGWLGLFDIVVSPNHRRQGYGSRLVEGLMAWGRESGAEQCYLQAFNENAPAIAMYEQLGFQTQYRYHYRSKTLHKLT